MPAERESTQSKRTGPSSTDPSFLVMMKKIGKVLRRIFVDKFICEEGVCRWHTTDEQVNLDQKDEQKHQVIFLGITYVFHIILYKAKATPAEAYRQSGQ